MTETLTSFAAADLRLKETIHQIGLEPDFNPLILLPEELREVIEELGFTPSDQQLRALLYLWAFVLDGPSHIRYMGLWGYGGVGKSTVIQLLIKALKRRSTRCAVAMCAPTNKAVKVLRRMAQRAGLFGIQFGTIHSMLNLQRDWDENGKEVWKPKAFQKRSGQPSIDQFDLVVIDEVSMVGSDLWDQIRISVEAAAGDYTPQVIAMGDPAQLPPVSSAKKKQKSAAQWDLELETGRSEDQEPDIKQSPLFEDVDNAYTLTQVMRYGGAIGMMATYIREHLDSEEMPQWNRWSDMEDGVQLLDKYTWLDRLITDYKQPEVQEQPDKLRALCYTNKTVNWLNSFIRHHLLGEVADEHPYVIGDRLITCAPVQEAGQKVLDSRTEVRVIDLSERENLPVWGTHQIHPYRHWVLTVLDDAGGTRIVRVLHPCSSAEFDSDCKKLHRTALAIPPQQSDRRRSAWRDFYTHKELFAQVEYAFCLTIHSSQGSTFERVYLPLSDIEINRRTRERNQLLYTAVTRASKSVILGA